MNPIDIFKALSNETRLQILIWLKEPEVYFGTQKSADCKDVGVCVSLFHQRLQLTQSTVSEYLAILQRAGLVTATRIGKWTYYKRNEEMLQKVARYLGHDL
ncbi:ArsR/SmtB family transcription factor [Paenibacillus sp. GCM10012307]|uniref:Helix-turn-helix transcriptional regulator n=1 Tax=Paenibacillus roseus TaxID=2798579 RepID=A0A934J3P2_9BACL|nr:metalloregulator ArsR/SmtB family transcription factor [Paenibacillus roseus]MBJ6362699.1 helix-turn-helix transcriptional regulator [Paenibacillus roseus]